MPPDISEAAAAGTHGPERPSAAGDGLVVESRPISTPLVIDPLPSDMSVTRASYNRTDVYGLDMATLYGDPDLPDTLDGPVLLVGTSAGSAVIGGPRTDGPDVRTVDLDGQAAQVVPDGDRTWVTVRLDGEDLISYVVARGVPDDELVRAAAGADFEASPPMLDAGAVPPGLVPLVAGQPGDGPFSAIGEWVDLAQGESRVRVSAVEATPRLAALWGFWTVDTEGTVIRGEPGSSGAMPGIILWEDAVGQVWAEDGLVISVIGTAGAEEVVDAVARALRPGSQEEFDALAGTVIDSLPTDALLCAGPDHVLTDRVGDLRWAIGFQRDASGDLQRCESLITLEEGVSSGIGSFAEKPLGGLSFDTVSWGHPTQPDANGVLVHGVAPPGTDRVLVVAPDGRELDALLGSSGPRPGERVYAAFFVGAPFNEPASAFGVTAFDATGTVIIPVG